VFRVVAVVDQLVLVYKAFKAVRVFRVVDHRVFRVVAVVDHKAR
jgi:hypothetical protein